MLLHSLDDSTIPVSQSTEMFQHAADIGHDTSYIELRNEGHGWHNYFDDPDISDARDQVMDWLP